MSNLHGKIETAFYQVITDAAISGLSVFRGLTWQERTPPCAVCHMQSATETPIGTGNYDVMASVTVLGTSDVSTTDAADDPRVNHNAKVESVFGAIMLTNLASLLSATQTGFYVFGVTGFDCAPTTDDGRLFSTTLTIKLYACETDIT